MRIPVLTTIGLAAVFMANVRAADDLDQVAPHVGETAIAVLRVDVAKADAPEIVRLVADAEDAANLTVFTAHIGTFLDELRAAKVQHVYAVYSLGDIGREIPYLIIPAGDPGAATALAATLLNGATAGRVTENRTEASTADYFQVTEAIGPVVFCGGTAARKRIGSEPAPERPGLAPALAAAEQSPVVLIYAPTADQQRVIAEMLPQLPDDYGGIDGATVSQVQWAAASNTNDGRLQVVFEAADEAARTAVVGSLSKQFPNVQTGNLAQRAKTTHPRVDWKSGVTVRSIMRLFGGLSNQFDNLQSLKQIGLAMLNFHDVYGSFPPTASYDGDRPLLSWRVHLLPWLDAGELYSQFHLNEPWDSEHNRKLIERMPDVFKSPDIALNMQGKTTFVLPVNDEGVWHGQTGTTIKELTDGTSNTIMALQTTPDHAVIWTKPDDLPVDLSNPTVGIVGPGERFAIQLSDGSAMRVSTAIPPATLKALITRAGSDSINWDFRK